MARFRVFSRLIWPSALTVARRQFDGVSDSIDVPVKRSGKAHHPRGRNLCHKTPDIVRGGLCHQILWRADLYDAAALHDGDAIGQSDRLVQNMGDKDHCPGQLGLKAQNLVLQIGADQGVKRGKRLVQKPDIWVGGQRAGDTDALLLATGQLGWIAPLAPGQAQGIDQVAGARLGLGPRDALHFEREGDVAQNGAVGQQGEMLEHHAHVAPPQVAQLRLVGSAQVLPVQQDGAGGRFDQTGEAAQQGGFAGT